MKKKFLAIYALTGALVASPVFTSCVDDSVSPSVEAQRNAKVEALKAEAAYNNALAQAATIKANAEAALNNANAAYQNANAEYMTAKTAWEKAQKEYDLAQQQETDKIALEEAAIALEEAKIELEAAKRTEEEAKANAALALEKAKLVAEKALLDAQKDYMTSQKAVEDYIAGLNAAEKNSANKINANIDAILNGGDYYVQDNYGNWNYNRNYSQNYYSGDTYNSIVALNKGLIDEKVNLFNLQAGLVTAKEQNADDLLEQEELIAEKTALIKKYQEFQAAGSNREAMEKAYEEAKENAENLGYEVAEIDADIYNANEALEAHKNAMFETTIAKLINDNSEYLTAQEEPEVYADTVTLLSGYVRVYEKNLDAVYEHTAEDAEELVEAIAEQEAEIAGYEAALEKVNGENRQRMLAVAKANADATQKIYDDVKASEAYKAELEKLEKAVADAQAEFDKNPTNFETYTENVENEDGTITVKTIKSTKTLLEEAETALEYVDYSYIAVEDNEETTDVNEEKTLATLYAELNYNQTETGTTVWEERWFWNSETQQVEPEWVEVAVEKEGLNGVVKFWQDEVDTYISGIEDDLAEAKTNLEELKELQAILAADSKEMKEYAELCEKRAELQKAVYALESDKLELNANAGYWTTLSKELKGFVGDGEYSEGSLPNWADKIEEAEDTIKEAEAEIAKIKALGTMADEATIAKKEAEIKAIETELEIRQAEYDAEVAALKALVGATEE